MSSGAQNLDEGLEGERERKKKTERKGERQNVKNS